MAHPLPLLAVVLPLVLTGSALAQYAPRHDYGAPMEPSDGIIHGIGQDGRNEANHKAQRANAYWTQVSQTDRRPALYAVYLSSSGANAEPMRRYLSQMDAWDRDYGTQLTPQAGVNLKRYVGALERGDAAAVAEAQAGLDEAIDLMNASGRDWYLRPGYEFNGEWNHYGPTEYVQAWRWFHDRLEARATFEHALIWTYSPAAEDKRYMPWYPGHHYVDWWGIDYFDVNEFTDAHSHAFLDDAHAAGKPVMIGEASAKGTGTGDGGADWDAWFAPFFDLLKTERGIKGFQYINWDWTITTAWPSWGDARIENDPTIIGYWNAELADPIFLHAELGGAGRAPAPIQPGVTYALRSEATGRYLDTDSRDGRVDQNPAAGEADKHWTFVRVGDAYRVINAEPGRGALDSSSGGLVRWIPDTTSSSDDKLWRVEAGPGGTVRIVNARAGRGPLVATGDWEVTWTANANANDPTALWTAEPVD